MTLRRTIVAGATTLALSLGLSTAEASHDEMTIASWGGSYTASQMRAYVFPYRKQVDYPVEVVDYNGGLEEIRAQVDSLNVKWDVVDIGLADAVRGCQQGLLEKIDPTLLTPAPDGTPAREDFLADTLQDCAVGENVFSTVVGYDPAAFPDQPPNALRDFFNLDDFPGHRGVRRNPQVILEWALVASGVAPDQVYDTLATEAGLDRAFSQLERIKPYIVWWENAAEPARLLADGDVSMTQTYNGRIQDAIDDGGDFAILWDGQVLDIELWAIPKGSSQLDKALDFIRFATTAEQQAEQARHIAYGPARQSAMALLDEQYLSRLPTAPENDHDSLQANAAWWAEHMADIRPRFEAWIASGAGTPGPSGTAL